ncbi:MAG: hypothetical protein V3W28_08275 [Thermoplasmata archaeon]
MTGRHIEVDPGKRVFFDIHQAQEAYDEAVRKIEKLETELAAYIPMLSCEGGCTCPSFSKASPLTWFHQPECPLSLRNTSQKPTPPAPVDASPLRVAAQKMDRAWRVASARQDRGEITCWLEDKCFADACRELESVLTGFEEGENG